MRLIGSLSNKAQADKFVAFLLTRGMQSHLEPEKDEFEIWVKDEDVVASAVDELEKFKANPDDRIYTEAVAKARELHVEEKKKRQRLEKNLVHVAGGKLKRNQSLTVLMIVICAIVALFTNFGGKGSFTNSTTRALAFSAVAAPEAARLLEQNNLNPDSLNVRLSSINRGEVWRLVTPIFLHGDVFHLLFNMYILYIFGRQIEHRHGSFWFAMLVLAAAAISNFVQCVVPIDLGGAAPFIEGSYLINGLRGMSGVNYALFGFILMRVSYDRSSTFLLPQSTVVFLLGWLVFCMTPIASDVFGLYIANWAHAIGLLVGLVVGYWPMLWPQTNAK